jgi:putative SOS response-associated peptidase YedK
MVITVIAPSWVDQLTQPALNLEPRFNICPTTTVDVVIFGDGKRSLVPMRWALIPGWWNMHASECRRYAEQCLQLAQELGPQHRKLLLGWADEWRRAAEELEELNPQEDQFGNKQRIGN